MVKQVTARDVIPIRHRVLRQNKPIESCHFTGDHLKDTYHIGVFLMNHLVGICTLVKNHKEIQNKDFHYQLRGMAILPEYQGKKLGKQLLDFLPHFLFQRNINTVWCNARIHAVEFYKKNGFHLFGQTFSIPDVGAHQLMYIHYE